MTSEKGEAVPWMGLLILLILAPLPSGSISSLAQSLVTGGVYGLWAIWSVAAASPPAFPSDRRLAVLMLCWVSCAVFAFGQALVPLPPHFIETLSPSLHDLYLRTVPGYAEGHLWRSLSTTPAATMQSGVLIGACGAAFFLTTRLCRTLRRMRTLALAVVSVGAADSIIGLASQGGSLASPATGTFVNRNHFAALLAMALCLAVGLLLARWQGTDQPEPGAERAGTRLEQWVGGSPLVILTLTLLAGIFFSFSRMGLSAPIVALALFGMVWLLGPVSSRIRLVGIGIAAVALLLMAGAWPALDALTTRFQTLEEPQRIAAWEGTSSLFLSSPVVGIGLGGLVDNLPRFLPAPFPGLFDHAHNEPLEILAEGGVIFAGFVTAGLALYWSTVVPAWVQRRASLARGLGLGCMAGSVAVLLHSLVEFPLRMPSNALYLSILMGLGWAVIFQTPASPPHAPITGSPLPHRRWRFLALAVALNGLTLSAITGAAAVFDLTGDTILTQARQATGETQQAMITKALDLYHRAAFIEPWQPSHAFAAGRAYEMRATLAPPIGGEGPLLWAQTAALYQAAARRHPANARIQAALAWASLQSGEMPTSRQAIEAAQWLAPEDPVIRFAAAKWYLAQWDTLSIEDRRLAWSLVHRGARESPDLYLETAWQLVQKPETVRQILPDATAVRRLLLAKLTESHRFFDRWAEQAAFPALRTSPPETGIHVLHQGQLTGRQEPPVGAASAGQWSGMVEGWLSGGLPAQTSLSIPPGEVVLYIPTRGQAAGGVWPTVRMTLGEVVLPLPAISGPDWQTAYVLLSTSGGTFPLKAVVTNAKVILENGHFVERRATLRTVKLLSPRQSS